MKKLMTLLVAAGAMAGLGGIPTATPADAYDSCAPRAYRVVYYRRAACCPTYYRTVRHYRPILKRVVSYRVVGYRPVGVTRYYRRACCS
jgi:hypothetical protein